MFAASFESTFNTFVKLKIDKIYDAIITTPVNAEDVVGGEYLWAGTRAALYGTAFLAMIVVLGIVFGQPLVTSWWALLLPVMLLVIGIMFSVMGTLFTSLIERIDLYAYYFTLVVTPLFLLSGVFFPVDDFPAPFRRSPGLPALPRGQRVQGARHGTIRRGPRRHSLDARVLPGARPDPGPDHAPAAHRLRVETLVDGPMEAEQFTIRLARPDDDPAIAALVVEGFLDQFRHVGGRMDRSLKVMERWIRLEHTSGGVTSWWSKGTRMERSPAASASGPRSPGKTSSPAAVEGLTRNLGFPRSGRRHCSPTRRTPPSIRKPTSNGW